MSALSVPCNIQNHATALAEGLGHGDEVHLVHLSVNGCHVTEDSFFIQFYRREMIAEGIIVVMDRVYGKQRTFLWGDIIELWLMEEKPNIYYSDVPEVAAKLRQLKTAVQKCAQADDSAGVLFLLDQVAEVKKAESLFNEAREIIANVQF